MYNISPAAPVSCHKILYGVVPLTVPPETLTPKEPLIPAEQSIASVVEAFKSIVKGSGSLIVNDPKSNSTGRPPRSVQPLLSLTLTL